MWKNRQVIEISPKKDVAKSSQLYNNAPVRKKKQPDHQFAVRPTPEDWKLIDELKAKTGLANSSLIRLALRRLAEAEGLKVA